MPKLATMQTQPVESAAICGTDSCTESVATKGESQSGMPNQLLGKFWHENQTASLWANSGMRIRQHSNGQILASESDSIPMGKFWHQNQTASQWANSGIRSDGIPMGKFWHQNQRASLWANSGVRIRRHPNGRILASESDGIPMGKFWHQNQTASQWANSGTRIRHHPNILKCEAGGKPWRIL